MSTLNPVPCSATNFDVRFSGSGDLVLGFCEVVFEPFVNSALAPAEGHAGAAAHGAQDTGPAARRLVLRRGFDGSLALYQWWDKSRRRRLKRGRTVTVHLLDPSHQASVVTWTFSHAQPVLLAYSPLHALHGSLLIETLTLHYDHVTMK